MTDPDYSAGDDNATAKEYKRLGTDLVVMLAVSFGNKQRGGPLDALTLWDRIESALRIGVTAVDDGDLDRFAERCMEHTHAVQHAYARSDGYMALLAASSKPASWRQGFVRYVAQRVRPLLGHGKLAYERYKREQGEWVQVGEGDHAKWGRRMSDGSVVVRGEEGESETPVEKGGVS